MKPIYIKQPPLKDLFVEFNDMDLVCVVYDWHGKDQAICLISRDKIDDLIKALIDAKEHGKELRG